MTIPPYDPAPPPRRRTLTALEAGVILGVVAMVILCCMGAMVLGAFSPAP